MWLIAAAVAAVHGYPPPPPHCVVHLGETVTIMRESHGAFASIEGIAHSDKEVAVLVCYTPI